MKASTFARGLTAATLSAACAPSLDGNGSSVFDLNADGWGFAAPCDAAGVLASSATGGAFDGGGFVLTQAAIQAVLDNVSAIKIPAEFYPGAEHDFLEDVDSTVHEPDSMIFDLLEVALLAGRVRRDA